MFSISAFSVSLVLGIVFSPQSDVVFFFFNDTATTEIYTLSLPRRSSDLRGRSRPSPIPPASSLPWLRALRWFALGRVAGECEEDVVERGAAQGGVLEFDVGGVEAAQGVDQRAGAVFGREREPVAVDVPVGGAVGERSQRLDRLIGGGIVAQAEVDHVGAELGLELVRGSFGDDAAAVDDDDRGGEPVDLLEVLGGQQDGAAVAGEAGDELPEVDAGSGVEPCCRLVEDHDARPADQTAAGGG